MFEKLPKVSIYNIARDSCCKKWYDMTVQCISVLRDSSYGLCWMESNCVILSCQRQWRHQNKPKAASLGSLQATKSCNPPPPPPMNKEVPFPIHTYWHTNVKNESEARQNDLNPFSWHTALLLINVAIITQLRWWIIWKIIEPKCPQSYSKVQLFLAF